ncbi:YiiX/YebB-like N1pC/P60 family cysteine hydrolase [Streptomyces massasporeus]
MRATEGNIADLIRRTSPGQVFFLHRRISFVAWGIMYVDNQATTNHVGIVAEDGNVVEALTSTGVTKRSFMDYVDSNSYLRVTRIPLTEEHQTSIPKHAESYLGTPYGWGTIGRILWQRISGHDHFHRANLPLYGDVLFVMLAAALPSLWWHSWPPVAWYVIGLYLLLIGTGALRRRRHRGQQRGTRGAKALLARGHPLIGDPACTLLGYFRTGNLPRCHLPWSGSMVCLPERRRSRLRRLRTASAQCF